MTLDGFVVVVAVVVVAVATAGQRKSGNELLDVGGVHVLANDHNGPKTNLFPKLVYFCSAGFVGTILTSQYELSLQPPERVHSPLNCSEI